MADTAMPSSQDHSTNKRSLSTNVDAQETKRARLEYLLSDPGNHSIFSRPVISLADDQIQRSNADVQSDLTVLPHVLDDIPTDLDVPVSPSDPGSACDNVTEPSTLPSPRSPPSSAAIAAQLVDKFTKSRAVGQSHRDNEKEHVKTLRMDVEKCRDENILLFALFSASYKLEHCKPLPMRLIADVHSRLAQDRPEDYNVLTDDEASRRGFIKLSNRSAHLLAQDYMSPALAVVLLDFVMYRRNIVSISSDASEPGYRRRKRRSAYRVALSSATAQEIVEFAVSLFLKEDHKDEDINHYVDRRLGSLAVLMERWSEAEAMNDPARVILDKEEDDDDIRFPPRSPTRPEAAEFGSPPRRRGEGAKRCSRCNMVKFTGSGHGRSKCGDGYSISSRIPYRPVPSSPGSECTITEGGTENSTYSTQ